MDHPEDFGLPLPTLKELKLRELQQRELLHKVSRQFANLTRPQIRLISLFASSLFFGPYIRDRKSAGKHDSFAHEYRVDHRLNLSKLAIKAF